MEPKNLSNILEELENIGENSEDGPGEGRQSIPEEINLLPLREVVMFPVLVAPLGVGRENSIKLVNESVVGGNRLIAVACMKDPPIENPTLDDVYKIGTVVAIRMMAQVPEGIRLIVQGIQRFEILEAVQTTPYLRVKIRPIEEPAIAEEDKLEIEALQAQHRPDVQPHRAAVAGSAGRDAEHARTTCRTPNVLTDLIAAQMPRLTFQERQEILETIELKPRMTRLMELLSREVQVLELGSRLQSEVAQELGKTQREYYLREHMRQIQKELGEGDDRTQELDELREKIAQSGMPEEARKEAERELDRLSRMNPAAPEYNVTRTYLDWMVQMPWQTAARTTWTSPRSRRCWTPTTTAWKRSRTVFWSTCPCASSRRTARRGSRSSASAGPPGVGKTSLGKSIAKAMGRKFVRMSLGGVRDEAEIRGHRRTYIGALPGQIIQGIKRAETNNPVFMMDEIDKVQADFRGDPSRRAAGSAGPGAEHHVPRSLSGCAVRSVSKVLFVTTANVLDTILPPLRDRMEIIEIAGYTEEEKVAIAERHLIPKQAEEHGIAGKITFTPDAVQLIVRGYTREAGVRNLEREIAAVCRKATRAFAEGKMRDAGGDARHRARSTWARRASRTRRRMERMERTGRGDRTGLDADGRRHHLHRGGGHAQPDEPPVHADDYRAVGRRDEGVGAGRALVCSRACRRDRRAGGLLREARHPYPCSGGRDPEGRPFGGHHDDDGAGLAVQRTPCVKPLLAMTGEVTLSGKVLPIGGIKEKVLGARRAGIKTIVVPERNRKDVMEDLPDEVRKEIDIHFVTDVRQVLELALEPKPGAAVGEKGEEEPTLPIAPKKEKPRRAPAVPKVVPDMPGAGSTLH